MTAPALRSPTQHQRDMLDVLDELQRLPARVRFFVAGAEAVANETKIDNGLDQAGCDLMGFFDDLEAQLCAIKLALGGDV